MTAKPKGAADPQDLMGRTYKQFARLLDMMEDPANVQEMTIPQLINALKALQSYIEVAIRRHQDDADTAGAAVRKYSTAFQTHGAGGRKKNAGTAALYDTDTDTPN